MMEGKIEEILLTFVVPCYNVEKYIQRCLDSIFACGLSENQYEVLCINDCSPDRIAIVLEQYKRSHINLRIINHDVNKGLGGGRNTGIREAKGLYLWFVDSDDEVVGYGFFEALKKAEDDDLDVLCFNYCRIDEEDKRFSVHRVFRELPYTDGHTFVKEAFSLGISNHMGYVWRFLYRTDFLRCNELFFPEQVHWEDTVFMPKSLLLAERVASVSDVFYAYRANPNSISSVFGQVYPAQWIYEFAFSAGSDLLLFSKDVKDESLKITFRDSAVRKYINGFPILLLRTSKNERNRFYTIVRERKDDLKPFKRYLATFSKLLLYPVIGKMVADGCAWVYRLKQKRK